jgi:ribosomal protein S18 acetylase RimI-like enzyme
VSERGRVSLRTGNPSDAEAVVALWTDAYFVEGKGGRGTPYVPDDFQATAETAAHFLVAELDDTVVGVVALLAPGEPSHAIARKEEAELVRLVVSAAARRKGIGRALADRCTELGRDEGWGSIALWSRAYQQAAHRLYESLGYHRCPERDSVDKTGFERLVFLLELSR